MVVNKKRGSAFEGVYVDLLLEVTVLTINLFYNENLGKKKTSRKSDRRK